jgi:hypothetical protein
MIHVIMIVVIVSLVSGRTSYITLTTCLAEDTTRHYSLSTLLAFQAISVVVNRFIRLLVTVI